MSAGTIVLEAERVGFEPTVAHTDHNGFRDRPIQPLWHLSGAVRIIPTEARRPPRHDPVFYNNAPLPAGDP